MIKRVVCYFLGHGQKNAVECPCSRCGAYVPYERAAAGMYESFPVRVRAAWFRFRLFHKKCGMCGTRNYLRRCKDDCIPF